VRPPFLRGASLADERAQALEKASKYAYGALKDAAAEQKAIARLGWGQQNGQHDWYGAVGYAGPALTTTGGTSVSYSANTLVNR
jgi:hypothetical protein